MQVQNTLQKNAMIVTRSFRVTVLWVLLILLSTNTLLEAQQGLKAEYYDGANFERLVATRIDSKIDFSWNEHAPHEGMNPHICSVRWTGKLKAPKTGWYHFSARVDDGIRVWVGDQLIIDDWNLNDIGLFEGDAELQEGQLYDFKVEYFNALNEAEIRLIWEIPVKKHWFKKLFYDEKKVIASEYFSQPEDVQIVKATPKKAPVNETKVIPAPKKQPPVRTQKKEVVVANEQPVILDEAPIREEITAEVIKKYTPKNIHFDRAKHDILPESFKELDELASFLGRNPHLRLGIEGHTDDVGNADKNLELSKRRAFAIARYLVKKGINGKRIKAEGFGGSQPLIPSEEGVYHPQNRRVEFIITDENSKAYTTSVEKK